MKMKKWRNKNSQKYWTHIESRYEKVNVLHNKIGEMKQYGLVLDLPESLTENDIILSTFIYRHLAICIKQPHSFINKFPVHIKYFDIVGY